MQQRSPATGMIATTGVPSTPLPSLKAAPGARLSIVLCSLLLDASLIWFSFCASYYLRYMGRWVPFVDRGTLFRPFQDWLPFGIIFSFTVLLSLVSMGLYRPKLGLEWLDEVLAVIKASLVGVGLVVIISSFLPIEQYSHLVIVYAWILLIVSLAVGRGLLHMVLGKLHSSGWNTRRVLVIGTSDISKMVMQNLLAKRMRGYDLVGFVQENHVPARADFGRFKCRGTVGDLQEVVAKWEVDEVIVALPATHHSEIAEICILCQEAGVAVKMVPDLFEMSLNRVRMDNIAGIPLIDMHGTNASKAARGVKRGMDIVLSGLVLLILSPLLLLTALAIKLDSPGPVFIKQRRVTKGGREFLFYKFRSMFVDAEQRRATELANRIKADELYKDPRDTRRTRVGRIIRQLSVDELPQLINVLKGDMSLVGPRPPLPSEVAAYKPHHFKRFEVIGGITGVWQVSGRGNIRDLEEVIIMDAYYIDNWSLALDLKILLRTVLAVLTRNGAY